MNTERSDTLRKLVTGYAKTFRTLPWPLFVRSVRGRPCLAEHVQALPHRAATELLENLRADGAPVEFTTAEWSQDRKDAAMERGSHASAQNYLGFVEHEMVDFIYKGFWVVLPYDVVKHLPNLRLSPLGVVPQRDRRPRLIVDYTFSGVNQETRKLAPREAMQFGRALDRILLAILHAPDNHGPVYLLKIDLSDGFYRVQVRPEDVPKLGLAFPTHPGEAPLVAFPLSLPMGWTESPPWFCAATETIADLGNTYCGTSWDPPVHPLEALAATTPPIEGHTINEPPVPVVPVPQTQVRLPPRPRCRRPAPRQPCLHVDVFVDDEIVAVQGGPARLRRVRRQLMHINDMVFRPNDRHDNAHRQEPMSEKKFRKGDAAYATRKLVLGWILDTLRKTIELPNHRKLRAQDLLRDHRGRTRISHKQAYKLLGELRSMQLGIPGSQGLLSTLQHALTESLRGRRKRVRLTTQVRRHIADLLDLVESVSDRPTRIAELFPQYPAHVYGLCDASKQGFGGVIFPSDHLQSPPIAWRLPAPNDIKRAFLSDDNMGGTITNSDLELAGTLLHESVLFGHQLAEATIVTGCDNTPAVAWRHKGSNSLHGPSAHLLRTAAFMQRKHRYVPRLAYVHGEANKLADIASRRFDLNDSQLLALLDSVAPQPLSWEMRHPPREWRLRLMSDLREQPLARPSLKTVLEPPTRFGTSVGSHSFLSSESTIHSSPASPTKSKSLGFLPKDSEMDGSHVVVNQSGLNMYATKSYTSRRRSPNWGPLTHDSPPTAAWTPGSLPYTKACQMKTLHPSE